MSSATSPSHSGSSIMRAHVMLIWLTILLLGATEALMMSENEFVLRQLARVPDFCQDYYQSSSAKWRPGFLEEELSEHALKAGESLLLSRPWHETDDYKAQKTSVLRVAEQQYSNHICDAEQFVPIVLSATQELSCREICHQCVPGSIPLCFIRNPFFANLAQVCLCTYDAEKPVEKAAFSIRHEKRIFSRRIRARFD